MENTLFIGITSAAGGSGLTSLSICLARTIKRMMQDAKCEILVLSFDALSSKTAPPNLERMSVKRLLTRLMGGVGQYKELSFTQLSKDEFGVNYFADSSFYNPLNVLNVDELLCLLNTISESKLFDYVILDIPFTCFNSMQQASCCEKLIINNGYLENQKAINTKLYTSVKKYINNLDETPDLFTFTPIEDRDSFNENGVDLHGQYAAMVREFATQFITTNTTE